MPKYMLGLFAIFLHVYPMDNRDHSDQFDACRPDLIRVIADAESLGHVNKLRMLQMDPTLPKKLLELIEAALKRLEEKQ